MKREEYERISLKMNDPIIEWRKCRVSGEEFAITELDRIFYDKISPIFGGKKYPIPYPTLCPDERKRRRLMWRNMYSLYKSECFITRKPIVTQYAPNRGYKATAQEVWWSDVLDTLSYGREYQTNKPFIMQYDELLQITPLVCLSNQYLSNENSEYVQGTNNIKNCYLVFNAASDENCLYAETIFSSNDVLDSFFCRESTRCYECIGIQRCHDCIYLEESEDCARVDFSFHCKGCTDCFLCHDLDNQKYCIRNQKYTKEEYEKELLEYLHSGKTWDIKKCRAEFDSMKAEPGITKMFIRSSENVTGNHINTCKSVVEGYDVVELENCKYIASFSKSQDTYDCFSWGSDGLSMGVENCYECIGIGNSARNLIGCRGVWGDTSNVYYSYDCMNCHDCFGCIGLQKKQYCILNRQHSKEEYKSTVGEIITDMMKRGEWGEFPSSSISPFAYNETLASQYYPMTKNEVLATGYEWSSYENPFPVVQKIIPADKLPDTIEEIPDDILNWAIECEVTGKPFKVILTELEFYRKMNIPLPRRHPDQRRIDRASRRI